MRIAYSLAQKAEAIALATVIGAEAAAERLHIDPRTVRKWAARAGRAPADAITPTDWAQLGDLARAQVASDLASGKVRTRDAAVIAGIASRNVRDPKPEPEPPDEAEQLVDLWLSEVDVLFPGQAGLALIALLDGSTEDDPRWDDPLAYLASLGDLEAWRHRRSAERHAAMERQLELNRLSREAAVQKSMDDETRALVAAAEAFLAESAA